MKYLIRPSVETDVPEMQKLFSAAVKRMRAEGNLTQWKDYPKDELLLSDIEKKRSYVMFDGDEMIATFMFALGDDPTYSYIEDGEWLNDEPYGTIHRIAGDGVHRGILKAAVEFCSGFVKNIRLDTHADNVSMNASALHNGFERCGIIYVKDANSDHEPRTAYQKVLK